MKFLDQIEVDFHGQKKFIELYHGDLTDLSQNEHFDLLVVSAFSKDYTTTSTSLVGALNKKNISVKNLSTSKDLDMLDMYACWLSTQINHKDYNGIEFERILCFEPKDMPPYEMIGNLFQALMIITNQFNIRSVGMPLLKTGDANYSVKSILYPLIEACVNWMSLGMKLDEIKIVAYEDDKAKEALQIFEELKEKYSTHHLSFSNNPEYHCFISYSHSNLSEAEVFVQKVQKIKPDYKVFMDILILQPGHSWQKDIFEAMDNSAKIVTLISPNYITSKVCIEEYNIAHQRNRELDYKILFPILLYNCSLPTYMKSVHHYNCIKGDKNKIEQAAIQFCL